MDEAEVGRGQTTKGIWMAANREAKILVFDIEGTDSKERGDKKKVSKMDFKHFQMSERTTSLFALAIADVLIINMWAKDVGRSDASNYEILRDIF